MTEIPSEKEQRIDNNRSSQQYTHPIPLGHYNHEYEGATADFQLSSEIPTNENVNPTSMHNKKKSSLVGMVGSGPGSDIFYGESCSPIVRVTPEEPINPNDEACLEDYKCPICLDTFINTVKVDCTYGHKFCNFCIQSWINFERHLVTECPVCRGPIFGKSLDLKTDAEIRVIYESLPDDEKNNRLLSIKERLQMEYPYSQLANMSQFSPGYQYPMRFSDAPHHHFNHDLHLPIPLMGVMEGAMQLATNSQENDYFQNFGESSARVWSQGMFYPSTWNEPLYSPNFQNNEIQNVESVPQQNQTQPVDPVDVHHQHYRHQSHESSRWNNNLYLTSEDTITSSHPQFMSESDVINRQNLLHEVAPPPQPPNYPFQSVSLISRQSNLHDIVHEQNIRLHPSILNYSAASVPPRNVFQQMEHYPSPPFSSHSPVPMPVAHVPTQPRLTTSTNLNGFYGCYLSSCPSHHHQCSSPTTTLQFSTHHNNNNVLHSANSHRPVSAGCSRHHQQMPCRNGGGIGHTSVETNAYNTVSGNIPVISHSHASPRNRSNMPGTTQVPSPTNPSCSHGHRTSSYHRTSSGNNAHSGSRQPVSRCCARNNGAQFSGGFSLFSSGYMGFQISHTPTTMMVGDRYMSTPPARLTHPLVSLFPLNQDGSSTRVCLTFEVHRV